MTDEMWEDESGFMELDSGDVGSPDELYKGGMVDKEGMYHVSVEKSEMKDLNDDNKLPFLEVVLLVRAAERVCESEIGKKTYVRFYLQKWVKRGSPSQGKEPMADSTRKALLRFLYGFTVIDADQFGHKIKWDYKSLEQRQAIVKIEKEDDYTYEDPKTGEEKTRKGQYRVQWGNAWRLDDEEVETVPKNDEALAEFAAYLNYAGEGDSGGGADPLDGI